MSYTYESMPPGGHESFATRIFQKLKATFTRAEEISYSDLSQLTPAEQMEDKIRFCDDYPDASGHIYFNATTGYIELTVNQGYDPATGYIIL